MGTYNLPDEGLLTPEERRQWTESGYLLVKQALCSVEVEVVSRALRDVCARFASPCPLLDGHRGHAGNARDTCVINAIAVAQALDPLLDHPRVFGKILGLMGPYIRLTGSELLHRHPHPEALQGLHTDGGPSLARILPHPQSLVISLKAQYFLTDVTAPGRGNMRVVPGSHMSPFPASEAGVVEAETRCVQVLAEAGDVVLFPWSLWHGAAANASSTSRMTAILRYSQLWCRPVDHEAQSPAVLARSTARRRRLLGDMGPSAHPGDFYRPPTHEHLDLIFGAEWRHHPECRRYYESEAFSRLLYEPRS